MKSFEEYQDQLLDHLYGLLDPDESRELNDQLARSPALRAALAKAEAQQRLIAAAAKAEFGGAPFQAPAAGRAAVLARPERTPWVPWVIAACLVLGFVPLAMSMYNHLMGGMTREQETGREEFAKLGTFFSKIRLQVYNAANTEADAYNAQTNENRRQITLLTAERDRELQKLADEVLAAPVDVKATGPAAYQPGVRNDYHIQVKERSPKPVDSEVTARVLDQANRNVFEAKVTPKQNAFDLSLPPDLPLKPGADLRLEVLAHRDGGAPRMGLTNKLELAAPLYLTYLTTDKPIYRPGEPVFFRSLTLERFSLKPPAEELLLQYKVTDPGNRLLYQRHGSARLADPQKGMVNGPDGKPLQGVGTDEVVLDPQAPAGTYTLEVSEAHGRFPPQKRTFLVSQSGRPQGNKERPADAAGKQLRVEFFPEGGALVDGLPNRVYFQAFTPADEPAALKGRVVDEQGTEVARVETWSDAGRPELTQGRGVFALKPEAGRKYKLKVDAPAGLEGDYPLPEKKAEILLTFPAGVTTAQEPIRATVTSTGRDRQLLVGAYCRGRLMAQQSVAAKKGEAAHVELAPDAGTGGVYRVTVFEDQKADGQARRLQPVAERLVYRTPAETLNLTVTPDKKQYAPGDKVNLTVSARTEQDQPAPAVFRVAVVDTSALKPADEKTARSAPAHFYLTTEVRQPEDLEYADFLLRGDGPSRQALDLVLGTQGWRRFVEPNSAPSQPKDQKTLPGGEDASRLVATTGQGMAPVPNLAEKEVRRVEAGYQARLAEIEASQLKAEEKLTTSRARILALRAELEPQLPEATRKRIALYEQFKNQKFSNQFMIALYALGGILLLTALISLVMGFRRRGRQALPYHVLALCSFLLGAATLGSQLLMEDYNERNVQATLSEITGTAPDAADTPVELNLPPEFKVEEQQEPKPVEGKAEKADFARAKARAAENQVPQPPKSAAVAAPVAPSQAPAPLEGLRPAAGADGVKRAADKAVPLDLQGRAEAGKNALKALNQSRTAEAGHALDRAQLALRSPPPPHADPAAQSRRGGRRGRAAGPQRSGAPQAEGEGQAATDSAAQPPSADALQKLKLPLELSQPFIVREYARQRVRSGDAAHSDGNETVYWNPALVLRDGKAVVSFVLSDAATGYRILVSGHTLDGRLGAADSTIEARAK